MKFPKDPNRGHLGMSDDDIDRGYSDASTPDGLTRNNNTGLRSAYEDGLDANDIDDQRIWGGGRDDYEDAQGMIDRPGLNHRTMIRRN